MLELGLATWRVSKMLMGEAGPWGFIQAFREFFGVIHDEDGNVIAVPDNSVLGCIFCLSVWVALVLCVLPSSVARVFAVSAVAVLIDRKLEDG